MAAGDGYDWAERAIEVYLTPATIAAGVAGNCMSALVLSSRDLQMKRSLVKYLLALTAVDTLFLAAVFFTFTIGNFGEHLQIKHFLPAVQVLLTASVYTVLLASLDRYFAICRPFSYFNRSESLPNRLIVLVLLLSVAFNVSRFFELRVDTVERAAYDDDGNLSVHHVQVYSPTPMRLSVYYVVGYVILANLVVMAIVPICAMGTFNCLVLSAMKRAEVWRRQNSAKVTSSSAASSTAEERQRQRNVTVTLALVSVVFVFILCHAPKVVLNFVELYCQLADWEATSHLWGTGPMRLLGALNHWLLVLNSSCNFYVFLARDPRFRQIVADKICCCCNLRNVGNKESTGSGGGTAVEAIALASK